MTANHDSEDLLGVGSAGGSSPSDSQPAEPPRFEMESLEARILMSATWVDAETDQDAAADRSTDADLDQAARGLSEALDAANLDQTWALGDEGTRDQASLANGSDSDAGANDGAPKRGVEAAQLTAPQGADGDSRAPAWSVLQAASSLDLLADGVPSAIQLEAASGPGIGVALETHSIGGQDVALAAHTSDGLPAAPPASAATEEDGEPARPTFDRGGPAKSIDIVSSGAPLTADQRMEIETPRADDLAETDRTPSATLTSRSPLFDTQPDHGPESPAGPMLGDAATLSALVPAIDELSIDAVALATPPSVQGSLVQATTASDTNTRANAHSDIENDT